MPRTVIIAVNDPNIRYLLQRYVEASGLLPVSPSLGNDVLDLLIHPPRPAVLILDADFPAERPRQRMERPHQSELANPQTAGGLRAAAAARSVPIVLYSYLDEQTDEPIEGVAACLSRSVMYDDFVGALKSAGVELESARHA